MTSSVPNTHRSYIDNSIEMMDVDMDKYSKKPSENLTAQR